MPDIRVKICGLKEHAHIAAAAEAGAAYVGFNFVRKSSRYVSPDVARGLAEQTPVGIAKVALTLDADNAFLDALVAEVPLDMLQLHGDEPPARVTEVKARYGLPVMKAIGIAREEDLPALDTYGKVADQLLVDAKPPPGGELPGGNGLAFDWRLIAGRRWPVPWMLAGGLTAETVQAAIECTGTTQVDLASGVETAPGVKDEGLIRGFMAAALS
ncbi:MAG: phosphoribosylanthranilate isomerase [Pseudomonadota bacterium]